MWSFLKKYERFSDIFKKTPALVKVFMIIMMKIKTTTIIVTRTIPTIMIIAVTMAIVTMKIIVVALIDSYDNSSNISIDNNNNKMLIMTVIVKQQIFIKDASIQLEVVVFNLFSIFAFYREKRFCSCVCRY